MAAPKPATPPRAAAGTPSQAPPSLASAKCAHDPSASSMAPRPTLNRSAILHVVSRVAIRPLTATAVQLTNVTTRTAAMAIPWRPVRGIDPPGRPIVNQAPWSAPPLRTLRKMAKPAARPAMPPVLATKNRVQP